MGNKYKKRFITTYGEWQYNPETDAYDLVRREGYEYEGPVALAGHDPPVWVIENYRFYSTSPSDTTSDFGTNPLANENVNLNNDELTVGDYFRLRWEFGDTGSATYDNIENLLLHYRINSGSWTVIGNLSTSPVYYWTNSNIADGYNDSTQRLSGMSGSTFTGSLSEYNSSGNISPGTAYTYSDQYGEYEQNLAIGTGASEDDVIEFRAVLNESPYTTEPSFTNGYPSITVGPDAVTASGTPTVSKATASGSVTTTTAISATGTPTVSQATATGTAHVPRVASGTPSLSQPTASGVSGHINSASGTPSVSGPTATGSAVLTKGASGSATVSQPTASGSAAKVLLAKEASGTPDVSQPTATGTAGYLLSSSGTPTVSQVTATGTVQTILGASGSATLSQPTASGQALTALLASGSATLNSPTASGTAAIPVAKYLSPTGLTVAGYGAFTKGLAAVTASGTPTLSQVTASGTAGYVVTASGTATVGQVTASGSAETTLGASGTPTLAQVTASGTAGYVVSASGTPTLSQATATGTIQTTLGAYGTATLSVITASGTAGYVIEASGTATVSQPTATGVASMGVTAYGTPTLSQVTASGSVASTHGAAGSATLSQPTASGLAGYVLTATGSATLGSPQATGLATLGPIGFGTPTLSQPTATGTVTTEAGVTEVRKLSPTGLVASYPAVLREFDITVNISGRAISASSGNVTPDLPLDRVQLGPHGLVTFDREFSPKYLNNAAAYLSGAQIDLEFATPDSADATIYPDGQDSDADAGTVSESEAQVSGAQIQALAGTSASAVNISATISGARIQALHGEVHAVPGTGVAIEGAAIVAQAGTTTQTYDYKVFGMSGAQIVAYHAKIGWDTSFDVGALVYGRSIRVRHGVITQQTSTSERQQGSWGGGGGKGRRKKFQKRKFHMPLAGVKLRDRPFENPVIEEEIEQIVDEVIAAAEELEAKGYAEAISADIIAEMARLKALADEALIRSLRTSEAISRRIAEAKLAARINELVRRRREYIKIEHARILRDQQQRARAKELERREREAYEKRKALAEWRANLLLNQPIEPYKEPVVDDEADIADIMLMELLDLL